MSKAAGRHEARSLAGRRGPAAKRGRRSGFTLIELLVVISVIALLIAILIPGLTAARRSARATVCGSQMKGLGTLVLLYATENQDWLPGLNTSSVALRNKKFKATSDPDVLRDPSMPTQTFDWMTPVIGLETEMPRTRAARMKFLTSENFKCPSQLDIESKLYDLNECPDQEDFEDELNKGDFVALSYLMSVHFQYVGQKQAGRRLGTYDGLEATSFVPKTIAAPPEWEVLVDSFEPRLGRVGSEHSKVMFADGTRYLPGDGPLDHDVKPFAQWFGSFTSTGAWWSGSKTYGVRTPSTNWSGTTLNTGPPNNGRAMRYSYRHGRTTNDGNGEPQKNDGMINAMFFDGHVERMGDRASRNIKYWYPRGSKVSVENQGLIDYEEGFIVP